MECTTLKPDNSFFRQPVDTESRLSLHLPCKIIVSDQELQGTVFNVSYSGIGVDLSPEEEDFDVKSLQSISIPDIGDFCVYVRWKRGLRMGLSFSAKRSSRPTLDAYFEKTGSYPF